MEKRSTSFKLLLIIVMVAASAAQVQSNALRGEFLFEVKAQGSERGLLRPSQVRYDPQHQEFYIADTGNDRIVILDRDGLFLFEFGGTELLRAPTDIAVDREGRIYALCTFSGGRRVQIFDYNGEFIGTLEVHGGPVSGPFQISSLVIDERDRLNLLDDFQKRVVSCELDGTTLSEFPLFPDLEERRRQEQIIGNLTIHGNHLYIPLPMVGSVYCYDTEGTLVKTVGHQGGTYGMLSFPIAASVDTSGNLLVLDKHRHTVVGYDSSGRVLGEIGGRGSSPGWFYHPISLLVDSRDRLWVTQIFRNRIQVLGLDEQQSEYIETTSTSE
jgi:sugar lactone lactonase YvrE